MRTEKDTVQEFFEAVYNQHRPEVIYDLYAEDYEEHYPNGARCSADAVRTVTSVFSIFPDLQVQMRDMIQEADLVAVRVCFSGTQMAEFQNIQPTGRHISWEAMEFFRVRNGRITESWGAWPIFEMIRRLTQ